jgi:predicted nucleic acid-binding protein
MTIVAIDTSVAIPLLLKNHTAHDSVVAWWGHRELALCGHALIETYAVLTRLPGDARLDSVDADRLIASRFSPPLLLSTRRMASAPGVLSRAGVMGGAAYDGLIALAAIEHERVLATRDSRALGTYRALGATVDIAA